MLHKTQGVVLRSVRYGDTSLITTIFTSRDGIQTYMVQGVRSSKPSRNRAGAFQPGTLLDLVVYLQPQKNMQRIREFQLAYIYDSLQESVIKNSIVLFSVELLLRLLPEHAPVSALFDFVYEYLVALDKMQVADVANFPIFFIIRCSRELGYSLSGTYSVATPYLNMQEGGFTEHASSNLPGLSDEDTRTLHRLLIAAHYEDLKPIEMNSAARMRILDWYITFLQQHTQHMGNIRSIAVLKSVLHY